MILKQSPPPIHTMFNPVLFAFEDDPGASRSISIMLFLGGMPVMKNIDLDFDEDGLCEIDLSGFLKSVSKKIDKVNSNVIVDNYQSISYSVYFGLNILGTFTTVRSVAQIRETQDLTSQLNYLLTGFDKLTVYEGYPRDVSYLADKGDWKGAKLTANRVNRLYLECSDYEAPKPYYSCTAEWSEWVCQQLVLPLNNISAHITSTSPSGVSIMVSARYPVASAVSVSVHVYNFSGQGQTVNLILPPGIQSMGSYISSVSGNSYVGGINITPQKDDKYVYSGSPIKEVTGYSIAKKLVFKSYKNGEITSEITKNMLTDVSPVLNEESCAALTEVELNQRKNRLLDSLNKCENFEELNQVIKLSPNCLEGTVIGYDNTVIDFGSEILINAQ